MSDTDDPNDALIILGDPLENPIPTIQLLLNGKFGLGGGAQFHTRVSARITTQSKQAITRELQRRQR